MSADNPTGVEPANSKVTPPATVRTNWRRVFGLQEMGVYYALALLIVTLTFITAYVGHDNRSSNGRPHEMRGALGGRAIFLDTGAGKGGALAWIDLPFEALEPATSTP